MASSIWVWRFRDSLKPSLMPELWKWRRKSSRIIFRKKQCQEQKRRSHGSSSYLSEFLGRYGYLYRQLSCMGVQKRFQSPWTSVRGISGFISERTKDWGNSCGLECGILSLKRLKIWTCHSDRITLTSIHQKKDFGSLLPSAFGNSF